MSMPDTHEPAPTVEALLAPEHFALLEQRPVDRVARQATATVDGLSGGHIERIVATGAVGERQYVVKRFSLAGDWIMRATGDVQGRAAMTTTSAAVQSADQAGQAAWHQGRPRQVRARGALNLHNTPLGYPS